MYSDCPYCRYPNSADDHRCQRCGRRLTDEDLPRPASGYSRAASPAAALRREPGLLYEPPAAPVAEVPRQSAPAAAERVVPFLAPHQRRGEPAAPPAPGRPRPAGNGNRRSAASAFLRPADPGAGTGVLHEPSIYANARVASPIHRALAACVDLTLILLGLGAFAAASWATGGPLFSAEQPALAIGVAVAVSMAYTLAFTLGNADTVGMKWMGLRLVNFDGDQPGFRQRMLRLAGSVVSALPLGLGLIWALFDEDRLGWQDYISGTFPTVEEPARDSRAGG